ncbi:transporter substrate-binding domain-containing protein [Flavobacteriaceae bacterium D16]|nr:transporter substrate-binding domain-containing protein [Flavobacteriaceae bacterium D16]
MNRPIRIKVVVCLLYFMAGILPVHTQEPDTLQIGIHEYPPFVIKDLDGSYRGLSVDLWMGINKKLNRPYRFVAFSDEIGIIRALDYGDIDLSINPLINTPGRMEKFEVTQPFYISNIGVAITSSSQSQFQIFINNFFSGAFLNIVFLLLSILLFFGTLLWLLERRYNKYQFRPGIMGLLDGLWWAAVTMTTVGYGDKAPKTGAGRAIAIIWMFTAVIIISSFTATIASTLTVNTLEGKIERLSDLKSVEKIGIVGASDCADFLFRNEMEPYETYRTPGRALRALANKDINVLLHDKATLDYLIGSSELEDKVQLLAVDFDDRYRCFIFPRGHKDYDPVNTELMRYILDPEWEESLTKYGAANQ